MITRATIGMCAALLAAGCDAPPSGSTGQTGGGSPVYQPAPPTRDLRERQMAFLNRIREADPQQRTIERALLNENNELGLILDRTVEMDKIPNLMRTVLGQM